MALENKQYLDWTGVQALWKKINAKFATQASLTTHTGDTDIHITAGERLKWDDAAEAAALAVSKSDYDAKVKEIENAIDGKANKAATLEGYGITDAYTKADVYTKEEVDGKISSVFSFKGTKDNYTELPADSNNEGDVWHVVNKDGKKVDAEYVWVAAKGGVEAHWEELGTTVDLSGYLTSDAALNTYATKTELANKFTDENATFAGTAAKATNADKAADSDELGGVAADQYAKTADLPIKGVKVNGADLTPDASKIVNVTVAEGETNGTIAVNGVEVSVHGLGTAAYQDKGAFATAAQGAKADTAIQQATLETALETALEPYAKTADVEKLANKADVIADVAEGDASTKYPTVNAVKVAIAAAVENLPTVDEKVKQTAITTGESPILIAGAANSGNSAGANYDANVKINAATGTLTATAFKGNLTGNVTGDLTGNAATATEATKASQDGNGKVIVDTYATKDEVQKNMVTAIDVSELEAWLDDPKNN